MSTIVFSNQSSIFFTIFSVSKKPKPYQKSSDVITCQKPRSLPRPNTLTGPRSSLNPFKRHWRHSRIKLAPLQRCHANNTDCGTGSTYITTHHPNPSTTTGHHCTWAIGDHQPDEVISVTPTPTPLYLQDVKRTPPLESLPLWYTPN